MGESAPRYCLINNKRARHTKASIGVGKYVEKAAKTEL